MAKATRRRRRPQPDTGAVSWPPVTSTRPAELRARNGDKLEMKISVVVLGMLMSDSWEAAAAKWEEAVRLMRRRPPEFVAQLERERLQRVRGGT